MIGICGMGGIGKTTLAKAVCNRLSSNFVACSFLANVREESKQHGVVTLQKQLLRDVLGIETHINNRDEGIALIESRIGCKKVLIIIDDVDHKDQLEALAANGGTMHHGKSRIIITCRDETVLNVNQHVIHKLPELDDAQSLQLFSWHAFGQCEPKLGFEELTEKVVSVAGGLPLCLKVFGSQFSDVDSFEEWNSMLEKLEQDQHKEVHKRLKISYDGLDKKTQCIFLDIACFFIGRDKEDAVVMWDDSQLQPAVAIKELKRKSLISISDETGEFEMHDQIRDMGRQIAKEEQSRVWWPWEDRDRTMELLKGKQERIEGIILSGEHDLETIYFENMSKLRLLDVSWSKLKGPYHHLPKTLKWLKWEECPLKSLPKDLDLGKVVILDLEDSCKLKRVWDGHGLLSRFGNRRTFYHLKVLNLKGCKNLKGSPDFRSIPNVVKLIFDGCQKLTRVDESIGDLKGLVCLSMNGCSSLEEIPDSACHLSSLETLDLSGCKQISKLPEHLGGLTNLRTLNLLWCCSLEKMPDSACHLSSLETLDLSVCEMISRLPEHLGVLTNLRTLHLRWCKYLRCIPQLPPSLISLDAHGCSALETISDVSNLRVLRKLLLQNCSSLLDVPGLKNLKCLEELNLTGCSSLSDASLWDRMKEANFQHFRRFWIPGRMSGSDSANEPQTISFFIPNVPHISQFQVFFDNHKENVTCLGNFVVVKDNSTIFKRTTTLKCTSDWGCLKIEAEAEAEAEEILGKLAAGDDYRMMHLTIFQWPFDMGEWGISLER